MLCKRSLIEKYCAAAENKAFDQYLRYGSPMDIPYNVIKAVSTHYLWKTQQDNRVRPTHKENHVKVFEWAKMPPTLHPGMARYCRCWAEAVIANALIGMESFIKMDDAKTWPELPISARFSVIELA
jgi:hypothetical protein